MSETAFQTAIKGFVASKMDTTLTGRDDFHVVKVEFEYDEGYYYSSYTFEDPSFVVQVTYRVDGLRRTAVLKDDRCASMGDFLTSMLAWEDEQ